MVVSLQPLSGSGVKGQESGVNNLSRGLGQFGETISQILPDFSNTTDLSVKALLYFKGFFRFFM